MAAYVGILCVPIINEETDECAATRVVVAFKSEWHQELLSDDGYCDIWPHIDEAVKAQKGAHWSIDDEGVVEAYADAGSDAIVEVDVSALDCPPSPVY